jgi:hypothetical protein
VTVQNGQPVFASSAAPKGKQAAGSAGSGAPSERSAVSDAWSGFSSGTSSAGGSGIPAAASSLTENGSGSTLGIAILGLGLVGMLGTFLVLAAPRLRRAGADRQGTGRKQRGRSGQ